MFFVLLILWLGPGALILELDGLSRKCKGLRALLLVLLEDLLTGFSVWALLFARYGRVRLGFAPEPGPEVWHTIYELGFMAKYAALTFGMAVVMGLVQRGIVLLWERRRTHGRGIPPRV